MKWRLPMWPPFPGNCMTAAEARKTSNAKKNQLTLNSEFKKDHTMREESELKKFLAIK